MAGDWIKMRGNLWDDPRVGALCDATDQGEAAIVGGLFWLWSTADQHTEDGFMVGLTLRQIDRKTGIKGFGAALCAIGWISEADGGTVIAKFDEHNGASAKRRSMDAQRKANGRKMSASEADNVRTETGQAAELLQRIAELEKELEKEREKEEEGDTHTLPAATDGGRVCLLMRQVGISDGNTGHPVLLALIAAGCTDAEFTGAAKAAVDRGKGFAYALGMLTRQREEAAAAVLHQGAIPATETAYARQMREKYEQFVPGVAAKKPGAASPFTIDMEPSNDAARLVG